MHLKKIQFNNYGREFGMKLTNKIQMLQFSTYIIKPQVYLESGPRKQDFRYFLLNFQIANCLIILDILNSSIQNMFSDSLIEVLQTNPSLGSKMVRKALMDITLKGKTYTGVLSLLFEHCIVFKLKAQHQIMHLRIKFDFDLLFQVQFQDSNAQTKKELKYIKLERGCSFANLSCESSQKQLTQWREYFEKTLKERGFHVLFKPLKKIGRGGFASVYLVQKNEDNQKYAVKAFSKQCLYAEEKGEQSLINQIEMMRRCSHKNLMKLHGVFQTDNSVYLQVQLLQGGPLSQRMGKGQRTTSLQIKIMMKGLLEGLQTMHRQGIMHRDIKPENILFRKQNGCDCVIGDFGLAESVYADEYTFTRCGTPGFVAPEVANIKQENTKYTTACDLFSVGVIFHMLLLKRSPFPGVDDNVILRQNRICNFHFQAAEYKELPELSLDLLKRLLEVNPSKRITASQALRHGFFQNEFAFWESNRKSHLLKIQPKLLKESCNNLPNSDILSPILRGRKGTRLSSIRQDSCLKLKMKENMMTGKAEPIQSCSQDKQSPLIVKRLERAGECRLRRMSHHDKS